MEPSVCAARCARDGEQRVQGFRCKPRTSWAAGVASCIEATGFYRHSGRWGRTLPGRGCSRSPLRSGSICSVLGLSSRVPEGRTLVRDPSLPEGSTGLERGCYPQRGIACVAASCTWVHGALEVGDISPPRNRLGPGAGRRRRRGSWAASCSEGPHSDRDGCSLGRRRRRDLVLESHLYNQTIIPIIIKRTPF